MHWRVFLVAVTALACGNRPEVKTYDDCILHYVKAGMDSDAVSVITSSCEAKFPSGSAAGLATRAPGTRDLTVSELAVITGRAGIASGNYYSGSLYNGTTHLLVTEVWSGSTSRPRSVARRQAGFTETRY